MTCDICRKNVHHDCAGLSRLEVQCIRSNSGKIHFYCNKSDIVSTIIELKAEVDGLKKELIDLKNQRIEATDSDPQKKLSDDEIIAEVEERNRRANNLILFHLPESNENTGNLRKSDNLSRCINTVFPHDKMDNVSILSCIRLGKYNADKIRPLKIIFGNFPQALGAVKSYKFTNNLYLNRDLTPRQQNLSYLVRSEYKHRKQQGEVDIVLKYYNGIPKIVKKQTKNA